ncbi:hypothetical protein D6821_02035 [Candidatus Parcubacteria bacterium]|nr:MAG: hypothetical protein D6821_02035 [Candidatus Parcubacteria bacterium]
MDQSATNPLLENYYQKNYYGAIPFDEIKPCHLLPALEVALKKARKKVQEITSNPETPDFRNTIFALEEATEEVELISTIIHIFASCQCEEKVQNILQVASSWTSQFFVDLISNATLWQRIQHVYRYRHKKQYYQEATRLIEVTYQEFKRAGADLPPNQQAKLKKINQRLAELSSRFAVNLMKEKAEFQLWVKPKDLVGVPENIVQSLAQKGAQAGKKGWCLITFDHSIFLPLMSNLKNRRLRRKIYQAWQQRGCRKNYDNRPIVLEIAKLRHQKARLLGYPTYFHYTTAGRMAKNPGNVLAFLEQLHSGLQAKAQQELLKLQKIAASDGISSLQAWDAEYYLEQYKQREFKLHQEKLRPYFSAPKVLEALFRLANQLYGLSFDSIDLPTLDPNIEVFKVSGKKGLVGLLYVDLYSRPTKRGGAWAAVYRPQRNWWQRPHVGIHCNFSPPTENRPSLLLFREVKTLFHEFGHALHFLLSDCQYRNLSSYRITWDFAELPSQVMEYWLQEEGFLLQLARHYQTSESLDLATIKKLIRLPKTGAGLVWLRQIYFTYLDINWHCSPTVERFGNIKNLEQKTKKMVGLPFASSPGGLNSPAFSHLFAGGYGAGYYTYLWCRALAADAFALFKESGFSSDVIQRFARLLASGNSRPADELYREFRGKDFSPDAFIEELFAK